MRPEKCISTLFLKSESICKATNTRKLSKNVVSFFNMKDSVLNKIKELTERLKRKAILCKCI